jgi:hypothetical protein
MYREKRMAIVGSAHFVQRAFANAFTDVSFSSIFGTKWLG